VETRRIFLVVMQEVTSCKRSRDCGDVYANKRRRGDEFVTSGRIWVEANKRAGRVGCCQSPPLQLHIYEFDSETRCVEVRRKGKYREVIFFFFFSVEICTYINNNNKIWNTQILAKFSAKHNCFRCSSFGFIHSQIIFRIYTRRQSHSALIVQQEYAGLRC